MLRVFRKAGISWGTFRDASGTHCNAHGNNFVLRRPTADHEPFLAPVDFDFCYTISTAVFSDNPLKDAALAQEYIDFEFPAFGVDLAGSPDSSGTHNDHAVPETHSALRWALRDTAVRAYLSSFSSQTDAHPHNPEWHTAAYDLLSLALIQTSSFIA